MNKISRLMIVGFAALGLVGSAFASEGPSVRVVKGVYFESGGSQGFRSLRSNSSWTKFQDAIEGALANAGLDMTRKARSTYTVEISGVYEVESQDRSRDASGGGWGVGYGKDREITRIRMKATILQGDKPKASFGSQDEFQTTTTDDRFRVRVPRDTELFGVKIPLPAARYDERNRSSGKPRTDFDVAAELGGQKLGEQIVAWFNNKAISNGSAGNYVSASLNVRRDLVTVNGIGGHVQSRISVPFINRNGEEMSIVGSIARLSSSQIVIRLEERVPSGYSLDEEAFLKIIGRR
jgi:hypothetical protein